MKTRIILSLVILLTVLSVKAQEPVETKIFPTNHIKRIETTVGSDNGEVRFPFKTFHRRLDAYYIFRSRGLVRYDVERAKSTYFTSEGKRICTVF